MVWEIELLYFVAMIAIFIVLISVLKVPSGIALMVSAVVGAILGAIFSGTDLSIRHFVEGAFGYFDTILVIVTAMIFIGGLEASGAMEYLSVFLVKVFRKYPTILLLFFMFIIMLPGMITGSSLASIVSAGAIVAPIMIKMGIPNTKVGAIVAFGAVLGMIAPPINVPVMVICDVVDIPYTGFTLPLVMLTFPLAIFVVLFLGRKFIKDKNIVENTNQVNTGKKTNTLENIIIFSFLGLCMIVLIILLLVNLSTSLKNLYLVLLIIYGVMSIGIGIIMFVGKPYTVEIKLDEMNEVLDFEILKKIKPYVLIPILVLVVLFICQNIFPRIVGMWGTPLLFVIAFIFTLFTGRKVNGIKIVKEGVHKSFSAMGLLMGVGMFVQIMTLNGVRGYFVINALSLSDFWQIFSMAIAMPVFGGISAFGSASILGGPYVMALLAYNEVIVASALSLVAALGEFLPPTAMSATFAGKAVGVNKSMKITKTALIPLVVSLVYAMLFVAVVSQYWV